MRPITIALVGNFRAPWCSEQHFALSYESLGHRVVRMQEDRVDWRQLPQRVREERADMLHWTRTWPVDTEAALWALDALRTAGIPSASVHLDRFWGLDREHQIYDEPFFRTDVLFSPDAGPWERAGVNHYWLPPGVYGPECTIGVPDRRRFPHDVVFVGSHPYPHKEWEPVRTALIDAMAAEFGPRFKVWPERRNGRPVQLRGKALADLYASAKVVVGDSCLVGNPRAYWSDRVPETLGRGALLVHPVVDGIEEWYPMEGYQWGKPDSCLLGYEAGQPAEAMQLVRSVLDAPEQYEEVRRRGQATVLNRDTYAHRMQTVLGVIEEQFGFPDVAPSPAPLPPAVRVTHRPSGARATFRGDQDNTVGEVWTDDTYGLRPADVRGKVVVDIGANVGAFSVLAAKMGAKRVVAYEPHPVTFGLLEANLAANGVKVVEARRLAITGDASVNVRIVGEGGGAFVLDPAVTVAPEDFDSLPAIEGMTLAAMLDEVGPIDLLKIDCEGAEYAILTDTEEHRLDEVARIVMEFHGPTMPHLAHLDDEAGYCYECDTGFHLGRWGRMVATLASRGRVDIMGRPMVGGIIKWARY